MSNENDGKQSGESSSQQPEKPGTGTPEPGKAPEPDTFPRSYVEELREESKNHRLRAQKADTLAKQLFESRVRLLGKLEDPTDLPFDEALLEDDDAMSAAVAELLERKPHLAARKVAGDIGGGQRGGAESISLAGMLRDRA